MGPTDPVKARSEAPESIRAQFGTSIEANAAHGSDTAGAAYREINFFFDVDD